MVLETLYQVLPNQKLVHHITKTAKAQETPHLVSIQEMTLVD